MNNMDRVPKIIKESSKLQLDSNFNSDKVPHETMETSKNISNDMKEDILDNAMKELLDFCNHYNNKTETEEICSPFKVRNNKNADDARNLCDTPESSGLSAENAQTCGLTPKKKRLANIMDCDSIESLRLKQNDLQLELDELLTQSKYFESREKRKLESALESDLEKSVDDDEEDDDDEDELLEFQQIENELRISELNRQLNLVQEKLRLRLYKRLVNNTTGSASSRSTFGDLRGSQSSSHATHDRRGSAQTDETTPPSSAFSDEITTSSNSTSDIQASSSFIVTKEQCLDSDPKSSNVSHALKLDSQIDSRSTTLTKPPPCNNINHRAEGSNQLELIIESSVMSSPERNSVLVNDISNGTSNCRDLVNKSILAPNPVSTSLYTVGPMVYRSNLISDLERINEDEDEDDCQDVYYHSENMRTIYEEKISPILNISDKQNRVAYSGELSNLFEDTRERYGESKDLVANYSMSVDNSSSINTKNNSIEQAKKPSYGGDLANACLSNDDKIDEPSPRTSNNGLITLYLPKPDEEIDLAEHVQALGHDIDLISTTMRLTSNSAAGYLVKQSSNSKKWLKRYFYFDRKSKTLSYFKYETDLVKRNCPPKRLIPFNEINDVYVDHKMNVMNEKKDLFSKSASKKNFVFILSTAHRRYALASPKAEIMRAWIDILFTAARSNDDYLDQADALLT